MDLYNKKKCLETCQNSLLKSEILPENIQTILKFENDLLAEGISYTRIIRYHYDLVKLAEFLKKSFKSACCDDLKGFVREMDSRDYAEWTKNSFRVTLKRFYKWLYGLEDEYPLCVKWVKTSLKNHKKKLPTEILTQEEVLQLVSHATNIRDKALIMTLYESGCRVGELLGLKLSDLEFGDYGVKITVNGKTGSRRILLISSLPYLSNWVSNHPVGNGFLWVSMGTVNHNNRLSHVSVVKILSEIGKISNIIKKLNPHNFRHSRASHLAKKLTECQLCQYFGWTIGSSTPQVYVHLSGRDMDDAILNIHGLKSDEEKIKEITPQVCIRCNHKNEPTAQFCSHCRMPLDTASALEYQERERHCLKFITKEDVDRLIKERFEELKNSFLIKHNLNKQNSE